MVVVVVVFLKKVLLVFLLICYDCFSLLREAEPMEEKRNVEMGEERLRPLHSEEDDAGECQESDDRKLLSRYGVWLLIELTTPRDDVPIVCICA